ncbi:MAG: 50S ribosomal protein L24 [Phycisphaerales bacterium]|nr:50S ribosomal protein L24 [Phycisphaerales bacterium]
MAAKVRKGDRVEVISGAHKGEQGNVLRVDPKKGRVWLEGVNLVYRHLRQSRQNPQGGRIQKEASLDLSNVLPVDPKTGRGSRVHFELERDANGKVVSRRRVTRGGTVLEDIKPSVGKS